MDEKDNVPSTSKQQKRHSSPSFRDIAKKYVKEVDKMFYCAFDPESPCDHYQENYDSGNMIRHFRSKHSALAESRGLGKPDPPVSKKQRIVPKRLVAIDRRIYVEACLKLVTQHHLPLSCFEWEGLKLLTDPVEAALDIKINRSNVKNHISNVADVLRSLIRLEVHNKLVSLKLDSASRHGRHILGINIQYELNGKLVIRTLAMLEMHERQTAGFLKEKVLEVLNMYGIKLVQLYSVTTDNGSNMIATVKQLQRHLQQSISSAFFLDDDEPNVGEIDIAREIPDLGGQISMIRCAVHTLQLAIGDVFKLFDAEMRAVTEIVKQMRHIKYSAFFEIRKASLPPLWSSTRWGGKYKMLATIVKQETTFNELAIQFPELCFSNEQWKFIKDYANATRPLYKCTKVMQTEQYPYSQFYLDWLVAFKEVKALNPNPFVEPLLTALQNRMEKLRDNPAFKASLYLDPRFNFHGSTVFRNAEEREEVQNFIMDTWRKISELNNMSTNTAELSTMNVQDKDDRDDFLTEMFGGSLGSTNHSAASFQQQLKALESETRQTHTYDVWNHWVSRKTSHPELHAVAMVALAAPSNQASVERSFSALAIVLSDLRTGLGEDVLSNILIVKLNRELFDKVIPDLYSWKENFPSKGN